MLHPACMNGASLGSVALANLMRQRQSKGDRPKERKSYAIAPKSPVGTKKSPVETICDRSWHAYTL